MCGVAVDHTSFQKVDTFLYWFIYSHIVMWKKWV